MVTLCALDPDKRLFDIANVLPNDPSTCHILLIIYVSNMASLKKLMEIVYNLVPKQNLTT